MFCFCKFFCARKIPSVGVQGATAALGLWIADGVAGALQYADGGPIHVG